MIITIRHPVKGETRVTEEEFANVFQRQDFVRVDDETDLSAMTREELNAHAENVGTADPASYANKAELIAAIESAQAPGN